jgi:DNA (cytosine-5)-methyltransferase 1
MLEDLMDPSATESEVSEPSIDSSLDGYRIYSLVTPDRGLDIFGVPTLDRDEFVVRCEEYGIPQSRHRVFLLGVRADIDIQPGLLQPVGKKINAGDILNGLPSLRSGLSRASDLDDNWIAAVNDALEADWWNGYVDDLGIRKEVSRQLKRVRKPRSGRGGSFVPRKQIRKPRSLAGWYVDERLRGICNHETKAHMKSDLHRYLFATCHARVSKGAIRLSHFPDGLLPDHKNVKGLPMNKLSHSNFSDRFAVLLNDKPAHTVVSHIAKDGHYYIHPDPTQCRSLTVREAARLQTFPDNYYFMGSRTEQYRQVGNAVPPLLSIQIAGIVSDLLTRARSGD